MDNFIYGIIDGSYQFGQATKDSDVDIIEIYNSNIHKPEQMKQIIDYPKVDEEEICKAFNLSSWKPSRRIYDSNSFIYNLFYEADFDYYFWLFPYKWLSENELTWFIQRYNEQIIYEDKGKFYERLITASQNFFTAGVEEKSTKMIERSFNRLCLLLEYARTHSYAESLQFIHYKNLLRSIRNEPYNSLVMQKAREEYLEQIDRISDFYITAPRQNHYKNTLIKMVDTTQLSTFYI